MEILTLSLDARITVRKPGGKFGSKSYIAQIGKRERAHV
jgi:hypothetical protein